MLVDELDQFRKNDEPDVEALEDLWNRCNAYRSRALRIGVGTIEWDEQQHHRLASSTRAPARAPGCAARTAARHQALDPDKQLVYDGDDDAAVRASARLVCATCAARWTEDDRQQAIRDLAMVHRGQTVDAHGEVQGPPRAPSRSR
jgi:alkylhydroperoxidase family enzyme